MENTSRTPPALITEPAEGYGLEIDLFLPPDRRYACQGAFYLRTCVLFCALQLKPVINESDFTAESIVNRSADKV